MALRFDGKYYSFVLGWVKARLGFTLVRATVFLLAWFTYLQESLGFEDAAAI